MCICVYVNMHIYIYMYTSALRGDPPQRRVGHHGVAEVAPACTHTYIYIYIYIAYDIILCYYCVYIYI